MGAACMLTSIIVIMVSNQVISLHVLWISLALGADMGCLLAIYVTMTWIPQLVALLNGSGGAASSLVAFVILNGSEAAISGFARFVAAVALVIGSVTFGGSLVAFAKLDGKINPLPVVLRGHFLLSPLTLMGTAILIPLVTISSSNTAPVLSLPLIVISLMLGVLFSIRVGGADMPIAISLMNSLSGLAAATVGLATSSPFVVAVGATVGSAGIVLTRAMCRAMNSSILDVLRGKTARSAPTQMNLGSVDQALSPPTCRNTATAEVTSNALNKALTIISAAKKIIIVPGYGMALAQAQAQVKQLLARLEAKGKQVKFAIHPVAGRMPGHMNVLLAEVEVPYDKLYPIEAINPEFKETDVALVVGANDVVNPAARTAQGTPIYGMPVLSVDEANHVIICNRDTCAGYAGVNNPLYLPRQNVVALLGNATETLGALLERL